MIKINLYLIQNLHGIYASNLCISNPFQYLEGGGGVADSKMIFSKTPLLTKIWVGFSGLGPLCQPWSICLFTRVATFKKSLEKK